MAARIGKRTGSRTVIAIDASPAIGRSPDPSSKGDGFVPSIAATQGTRPSATIWFKEPGQPDTWHIVAERLSYGWYRMACAWECRLANAERLWPAKSDDAGPPNRSRCVACGQGYDLMLRLGQHLDAAGHLGIDTR